MRREIDELFGDVFERSGFALRGAASRRAVDVYYCDDPPRAVVNVDLAGVDIDDVALEIRGRQLLIAGERRPARTPRAGSTSRSRSSTAPSAALVELGADVVAERRAAPPTRTASCAGRDPARPTRTRPCGGCRSRRAHGPASEHRRVPIQLPARPGRTRPPVRACPTTLPVLPLQGQRAVPGHADPAGRRPGALGARSINDVLGGNRMLVMVASQGPGRGGARSRRPLRRGRRRRGGAHAEGARRDAADPRAGRPARGARRTSSPPSPT